MATETAARGRLADSDCGTPARSERCSTTELRRPPGGQTEYSPSAGGPSLSAAIKAGARLHPQAIGAFIQRGGGGRVTATCANGAAVVGALALGTDPAVPLGEALPLLAVRPPRPLPCGCPARGRRAATVAGLIDHLNDDHGWRRETIAGWVASLEKGK